MSNVNFQPEAHQGQDLFKLYGVGADMLQRLKELTGNRAHVGLRVVEGKGPWSSTADLAGLAARRPMFITTTARSRDPQADPEVSDSSAFVHLADGLWLDIDAKSEHGQTIGDAIAATRRTANKLQALGIDRNQCSLFASGGKGFHVYAPLALLQVGFSLELARGWRDACLAFVRGNLVTDLTDLSLYCHGNGKLIRQANVQRSNGRFKVPMTWQELDVLDAGDYTPLCSRPRPHIEPATVNGIAPAAARAWDEVQRAARTQARRPAPARRAAPLSAKDGQRIKAALKRIAPVVKATLLPYEEWLMVGRALKASGAANARELWENLSMLHPK